MFELLAESSQDGVYGIVAPQLLNLASSYKAVFAELSSSDYSCNAVFMGTTALPMRMSSSGSFRMVFFPR
jgi:hypothetical protein